MEKLIDYTKYTTAMAVALILYIPANLLPTDKCWHHWILGATTLAAGLSALAGILVYTRASKLILANKQTDDKGEMTLRGDLHMWLLVVGYLVPSLDFFADKVVAAEAETECSATFPSAVGPAVTRKL